MTARQIGVTFIPATHQDAETLITLMHGLYDHEAIPFHEADARVALIRLLDETSLGRVWMMQSDGELAGYCVLALGYSLEFHGRDAFLDELFVLEAYRGRGIGGQTIRFLEEQCRTLGVRALHLEVERENVRAQALYRSVGFEDHDRYLMTKRIVPDEERSSL